MLAGGAWEHRKLFRSFRLNELTGLREDFLERLPPRPTPAVPEVFDGELVEIENLRQTPSREHAEAVADGARRRRPGAWDDAVIALVAIGERVDAGLVESH